MPKRALPALTRMLFAILLLAVSMPAHGQGTSKVQGYIISVGRLYEDLEYEQALQQIARARRLPRTTEENVTLSFYEGIILADMSRWEESAAAFRAALSLDPAAKLPIKVAPKVEQQLETVRQQVQRDLARTKPTGTPPASQLAQQAPGHPPAETPPVVEGPQDGQKSITDNPARVPLAPDAVPTMTAEGATPRLLRSQVLIPAVAGGVLVIAGGTSWALSRRELSRLRNNDLSLPTQGDAHSSASRGRTYQTVGMGLLGAGMVGLGVATALYVRLPPNHNHEVTLGLSTDGTSAFVQGRWP